MTASIKDSEKILIEELCAVEVLSDRERPQLCVLHLQTNVGHRFVELAVDQLEAMAERLLLNARAIASGADVSGGEWDGRKH